MSLQCDNFTSIQDFLTQAVAGGTNITAVIGDCPAICSLAWGSGNPDLSGIGAYIAYILQAGLTFIFGPGFVFVFYLIENNTWSVAEDPHRILVSMQASFLDASAGFSIPVAIATIVRIKQFAPFYELAFLEPLTTMQFLSLIGTSIAMAAVRGRQSPLRIVAIAIMCIIEFGLYMGLVAYLRTSPASVHALEELGTACKTYGLILPGFQYFRTMQPLPLLTAAEYFNPLNRQRWIVGLIVTGFIFAAALGLLLTAAIVGFLGWIIAKREHISLFLISLAFAIGSAYCTSQMRFKRNVMKEISGDDFQDNQWGFGQVIALFLWSPIVIQSLNFATMYCATRGHSSSPDRATDDIPTKPACKCSPECKCLSPPEKKSMAVVEGQGDEITPVGGQSDGDTLHTKKEVEKVEETGKPETSSDAKPTEEAAPRDGNKGSTEERGPAKDAPEQEGSGEKIPDPPVEEAALEGNAPKIDTTEGNSDENTAPGRGDHPPEQDDDLKDKDSPLPEKGVGS